MDVILFKTIEHEIHDLDFAIDEIMDEITDADTDTDIDIDALHERRKQLERRRAVLQTQILHLLMQR